MHFNGFDYCPLKLSTQLLSLFNGLRIQIWIRVEECSIRRWDTWESLDWIEYWQGLENIYYNSMPKQQSLLSCMQTRKKFLVEFLDCTVQNFHNLQNHTSTYHRTQYIAVMSPNPYSTEVIGKIYRSNQGTIKKIANIDIYTFMNMQYSIKSGVTSSRSMFRK